MTNAAISPPIGRSLAQSGTPGNLVILTNTPTPYRTNFFNMLHDQMQQAGHRLVIAYCARTEWHRHWDFHPEANRHEHHFLPGRSIRAGVYTFHFNPSVLRLLSSIRPTWLLSAGAWNMPTGLMALAARRRAGFKALFWSEGHADAVLHKSGIFAMARRMVLRRYDGFAVPNARSAEFLASELGHEPRCIPLPNTVDDVFFREPTAGERTASRKTFGLKPGERLLVQTSRLEHRKGVLELCSAVRSLGADCPQFRLGLIGTGTLESQIRAEFAGELESGRILLPGAIAADAVRSWLFAADGFILASRRDPNPLSSIEAALCGVPLILSRFVGNIAELLPSNGARWTLREVTAYAIEEALRNFTAMPASELESVGRQRAANARSRFSTRNVAQALIRELGQFDAEHAQGRSRSNRVFGNG